MAEDKSPPGEQPPQQFSRSRVEQDFLAAFESFGSKRFFDFVEQHMRPDGVLVCNCPPELLQLGGAHHGVRDTIAALRSFFVEFQVTATSVDDIVIDGSHVVVNYQMSMRHVGTGRTGRVSGINHYVLDIERKITKCSIFLDNASLAIIGDLLEAFTATTRGMEIARNRRDGAGDE